jgi:hypothetical protein
MMDRNIPGGMLSFLQKLLANKKGKDALKVY